MSSVFDAWWLPDAPADLPLRSLTVGELQCRYPVPGHELVQGTAEALQNAGEALRRRPVREILDAVDAAAARLAEVRHPFRQEAEDLLTSATGYSPEMTRLVLDRMTADWRRGPLVELLRAEFGDTAVLDGFASAGGAGPVRRRVRAYGPRLAFQVFAGNVPGVAVTSLIRMLLVKGASLGKLASGQPVLPVLFARALDSVDPELARALAITYWPGGSEWDQTAAGAADLVVVYGGADAAASFRERVPDHERLVVHGPRFSVGAIGSEALGGGRLTDQVAAAVAAFDQHGCVSPHAIWVESNGTGAARFAKSLAEALQRAERSIPRGRIGRGEAAAIQQERGAAELRAHAEEVRVFTGEQTTWTVVYDPEPAFRASCLNRFVRVHPVPRLEELPPLLAPVGRLLQSVALACDSSRRTHLADRLARVGATRITTFERLPWPPPAWHHDGSAPLRELVRWVDLEE